MKRWSSIANPQSTPLRLTGTLILIFTLSALISFLVAYWVVRSTFDASLKQQVHQTLSNYQAANTAGNLLERLKADASTTNPTILILQYWPDNGPRISNVESFPLITAGMIIIHETDIRSNETLIADSYLASSSRVGAGQLIVAHTREQVVEMGETFLVVFLVGLIPTIAIAAAAGLFVAQRASKKLDSIQHVLTELTSGQLKARVITQSTDKDDLTQISNAVNQMADAQEALIASLRQVTTDIAHDLKTPIQRVAVILEQVINKSTLSQEQNVQISKAMNETQRIVKTFDALLRVAQIEGGTMRDRFVPTDLEATVATMVDLFSAEAEEQGFHLDFTVHGSKPFTVQGERHLLGQVVANLIGNALRHVPNGGRIGVSLARQENHITLSVCDDGPGIPAKEHQQVLQRMYRLERSRHTDGNGLGLSLVAAACNLHQATLTLADNAPGLLVCIEFPAQPIVE